MHNDPIPMHEKLKVSLDRCLKILEWAPISKHHKYILIRSIIVPRINYGPLTERCKDKKLSKEQYIILDKIV